MPGGLRLIQARLAPGAQLHQVRGAHCLIEWNCQAFGSSQSHGSNASNTRKEQEPVTGALPAPCAIGMVMKGWFHWREARRARDARSRT